LSKIQTTNRERFPVRVRHQEISKNATVEAYRVIDEDEGNLYYLRSYAGRGKGGPNEPSVTVVFNSAAELRDFAVGLLSLVAVEESRV
jgi:hypothetical protein